MAQPWLSATVQRLAALAAEQAAKQPAPPAPAAPQLPAAAAPSEGAAAALAGQSTRPSHACQGRLQPIPPVWEAPARGQATLRSVREGLSALQRWLGDCKVSLGTNASQCDLESAIDLLCALLDVPGVLTGAWVCDQHAEDDSMSEDADSETASQQQQQQQREQQPSGAQPSSLQRGGGADLGCMGGMGASTAQPGAAQQQPSKQPSKPEQQPKKQRKRGRRGGRREQARRARAQPMRARRCHA